MQIDVQSPKHRKTLVDLRPVKEGPVDFSKEENRAKLKQNKSSFADYPTEIITITVLVVLNLLYWISTKL